MFDDKNVDCVQCMYMYYVYKKYIIQIQEIYQYHHGIYQRTQASQDNTSVPSLSSELLQFLGETLQKDPITGHSLIQSLLSPLEHSQIKKNNDVLQVLYIQTIQNLIEKLEINSLPENGQEKVNLIYTILSLYNPEPLQNYISVRELFTKLLILSVLKTGIIDKQKVISVLIGKSNTYLLDEIYKLEYELEIDTFSENSKKSSLFSDLSDKDRFILSVTKYTEKEHRLYWVFLWCLKQKEHFLKAIFVSMLKHFFKFEMPVLSS